MSTQPGRVEYIPFRANKREAPEDRVVLRLSRDSLKSEPPVVRFVERLSAAQQGSLWPA